MGKYELETNMYGNVTGIPEGWFEVNINAKKLNAFNIPYYKAHIGWNKRSKRHINPILVNIIPVQYKSVLTKKLKAEEIKNSPETRKKKWVARLVKLSGCEEERAIRVHNLIIEGKKNELNRLRNLKNKSGEDYARLFSLNLEAKEGFKAECVRSKDQAANLLEQYI